jgi:hypothetical protein
MDISNIVFFIKPFVYIVYNSNVIFNFILFHKYFLLEQNDLLFVLTESYVSKI